MWADGRLRCAHRLAWELANGPLRKGIDVVHACDDITCMNLKHLFLRERGPIAKRFWPKVRKTDGCWIWIGALDTKGYGHIGLDSKKRYAFAHRVSWMLAYGSGRMPDADLLVCHRCDNPPCVRPDHLFVGTNADNTRDMIQKGRAAYQRRVSAQGLMTNTPRSHPREKTSQ